MSEGVAGRLQKVGRELWKKSIVILACLVIIGGSAALLFRHYANNLVDPGSDIVYAIESKLLDLKFNLRGPIEPTGQIGILAIDEKTLTRFGTFPIARKFYGPAMKNLKKLGVKFVGYDVIFIEQEKGKLQDIEPSIKRLERNISQRKRRTALRELRQMRQWFDRSPGDQLFAQGLMEAQNVILGFLYYGSKHEAVRELGDDEKAYFKGLRMMEDAALEADLPEGKAFDSYYLLNRAYGMRVNIPELTKATDKFAFFNNDADSDAINRWVTLVAQFEDLLMPSLGLKIAAEHLDSDVYVFFNDDGVEGVTLVNREDDEIVIEPDLDPNGQGRVLVNHRGPSHGFKHYSLADAYYNSYTDQEKKELKGMSLLMGGTASGTQDLRPNPYDPAIDGVENHAAVADSIIRQDWFKRDLDSYGFELILLLIVGFVFAPVMIWGSSFLSGFSVVAFLAGYWWYDWHYLFSKGEWGFIAMPSLEILTMFVTTTLLKYAIEEREKKKVKGTFEHYLSPEVIEQVLDDPTSMALGGKREDITIFFSDVRGFTSISEKLSPEKLCEFMNIYFNPMTRVVLETGGTLDKYIGDAIMAFWGAPIKQDDHPARAAKASIEMLYELDKLREDMPKLGFPQPDIGIGLNTGPASVGNMGSDLRFTYTALADSVNLAARLEGITKQYGVKILVSEFTIGHLNQKDFYYRDLDDIRVKGKEEPVKVFELIRPDLLKNEQHLEDLIGEFELGRKAYIQQDWEKATAQFVKCKQLNPNDGPVNTFLGRIEEYRQDPPPPADQWDGVYTFKTK